VRNFDIQACVKACDGFAYFANFRDPYQERIGLIDRHGLITKADVNDVAFITRSAIPTEGSAVVRHDGQRE
jgi:hypothetical protein